MSHVAPDRVPVITIDGPSGTGKGTLCHQLAQTLGWHVLDSGAIYRALAWAVLEQGISAQDVDAIAQQAQQLPLRFVLDHQSQVRTYLAERDVSAFIRSERVGQEASRLASFPEIRAVLLQRQRDFAQMPGLVTDGRDMGTVVFPNADMKIFLTASAKERATRRYLQLKAQGIPMEYAQVLDELEQRDQRDMARSHAPLKPAQDAIIVDTTGLAIAQVLKNVLQLAAEHHLY